jgi:predicted DsbA family dithiol-disulfide isomerase
MKLVVYGDFNCPYSALASVRADRLLRDGEAEVEWRAVQHDAAMPPRGSPVDAELKSELEREIAEIHGLMQRDEIVPLEIMEIRPNTAEVSRVFSTLEGEEAHFRRRDFFDAVWAQGRNVSDPTMLGELGTEGSLPRRDVEWQAEWSDGEPRVVPRLVLADGTAYGGVEALEQLAAFAYG